MNAPEVTVDSYIIESLVELFDRGEFHVRAPSADATHRGRAIVHLPGIRRAFNYECWFTQAFMDGSAIEPIEVLKTMATNAARASPPPEQ